MFKIEGDKIHITQRDKAVLNIQIEDYIFQAGDILEFSVYRKNKLTEKDLFSKKITCTEECESIDIELLSSDTEKVAVYNSPVECWYEISLINHEQTVLGYDENGAKKFIVYPNGVDANE